MPVTAKLSRRFYETFGDEVTNEVVEWFNQVDLTYRGDLRELNELNFARFDAKVEQRFAEFEGRWEKRLAELEARWEKRLTEFEARWEKRLAELEARWEKRFSDSEAKWDHRFGGLETQIVRQFGKVETQMSDLKADLLAAQLTQTRWLIGIWATLALAIIGLYLR